MGELNKINDYTDLYYYLFRNSLFILIPALVIIAVILSFCHHSSATTSSSDQVVFNISTSCTMSSEVSSPHTANLNGGQHKTDVGTTKLNAYCNDNNGYSIYAVGTSNGVFGNTDLVSSVSNDYNIHTNIYNDNTVTSSTPSSWSMKLTAGVGTGINPTTGESVPITPPTILNNYDNYNVIPNVYTLVAKRTSSTDMTTDTTASGSYLTTTYDIYANSLQPSGTYTGSVKYLMVHPAITTNQLFMQDIATWKDSFLKDVGDSIEAIDNRDGKKYWVTRLADGNVWMTQNLDLDLEATPNNVATLTSENTDLSLYGSMGYDSSNGYSCSNVSATCENGVITWTPERATIPEGSLNSTTWKNDNNNPYSYDNGLVAPNGVMDGHGYTGNYYNWSAAIASNNSSNYSTNNTVATNSICPKGWRLPNAASMTGGYEFSKLLYEYGITTDNQNTAGYATGGFDKIITSPLYFVRAGIIGNGSIYNNSTNGYYLSNILSDTYKDSVYNLDFNSDNVNPASNGYRDRGRSIRCLAE